MFVRRDLGLPGHPGLLQDEAIKGLHSAVPFDWSHIQTRISRRFHKRSLMNAYQNFLDFFSTNHRQRLDGLNELHFKAMTAHERALAFDYLVKFVEEGGSRETVNGLFMADAERAGPVARELLEARILREDAEIAAAWQLQRVQANADLLKVFIRCVAGQRRQVQPRQCSVLRSGRGPDGRARCGAANDD